MNIIEIDKIMKKFGGLVALDNVTIRVCSGHIHSLIGPNGAGKTTLFNVITRTMEPDSGNITFKGIDLLTISPFRIASLGIGRTFQAVELFDEMTVLENVMVGCHSLIKTGPVSAAFRLKKFVSGETFARRKSLDLLQMVGLEDTSTLLASSLSLGQKRLLELARALAANPDLLLLDEPASGLNNTETRKLIEIIRNLRNQLGATIFLVEHDMRVVMEISDTISVLNHGLNIAEGKPDEIKNDPGVIEAYLGSENHVDSQGH